MALSRSHNILQTYQSSLAFQTAIPHDLVVEFSVQNNEVIVSIYFMHRIPPNAALTGSGSPVLNAGVISNPKDNIIGQKLNTCVNHNYMLELTKHDRANGWAEVVDYIQVHCPAQVVKSTTASISQTYQLCAELRDKIILFMNS